MADVDTVFQAFYPLVTFLCGVALGFVFGRGAGERRGFRAGVRAARDEAENGWRR